MPAKRALRKTIGEHDRSVDGADHLESRDLARIAREPVAAIGAVLGGKKTAFAQLLQQLGKNRQRDATGIGDFFGADGLPVAPQAQCKMLESNETVICLLCKPEHSDPTGADGGELYPQSSTFRALRNRSGIAKSIVCRALALKRRACSMRRSGSVSCKGSKCFT